jgi:hypothetical protein
VSVRVNMCVYVCVLCLHSIALFNYPTLRLPNQARKNMYIQKLKPLLTPNTYPKRPSYSSLPSTFHAILYVLLTTLVTPATHPPKAPAAHSRVDVASACARRRWWRLLCWRPWRLGLCLRRRRRRRWGGRIWGLRAWFRVVGVGVE